MSKDYQTKRKEIKIMNEDHHDLDEDHEGGITKIKRMVNYNLFPTIFTIGKDRFIYNCPL